MHPKESCTESLAAPLLLNTCVQEGTGHLTAVVMLPTYTRG